jgi:hypothetical protein
MHFHYPFSMHSNQLIAGEEPELCVRVRALGWPVWRIVDEMALHDSAMLWFGQWWKRSLRAGHAFAQGAALHGGSPERHYVRESYSAWLWALGIPLFALVATALLGPAGLLAFAVYPIQVVHLALRGARLVLENWLNAAVSRNAESAPIFCAPQVGSTIAPDRIQMKKI